MIFFLLISQLNIDVAKFFAENNFTRCEVYINLPYNFLTYKKEEDKLKSEFKLKLLVNNKLINEWNKISYINSYEEAETRNLNIIEQIDLFLEPGKYNIEIEIISDDKKLNKSKVIEVLPHPLSICISDIQLSSDIKEEKEGKFVKNGLFILPNPQCIFWENTLYGYAEIYNLKDKECKISYKIITVNDTELIFEKPLIPKGKDIIEVEALDISKLENGKYILRIEVSQGNDFAVNEKEFFIIREVDFTEEEMKYYDQIQYVASNDELSLYNRLNAEGKKNFIKQFWKKKGKALLNTLIERIKYADEKFSSGTERGKDSDRGWIWIKYGEPDEVVRLPITPSYPECEKWTYFSKNCVFIFVDKLSCGRWELVYSKTSSAEKEYTDPNYIKWVNPEILE